MTLELPSPDVRAGTYPRGFQAGQKFHWPLVRAENLVTLNYGKALVDKNRSPGTIPVYGTNGRCGWHDTALRNGPTVLLGRKGMGNLGIEWCDGPFWVIDTAYFVTPNHGVELDLKFFYFLMKYIGLNHLKDGTSNPSLSRSTFYSQLLPYPSLPDQQAIARVLSALDDKIDLNRRMNETLETMARSLFQSWFVDFDPVTAKAAGRPPQAMSAATAALFPAEFEDSECGPIPLSWGTVIFDETLTFIGGGTPKTSEPSYWGGDIPWFSVTDAPTTSDVFVIATDKQITELGLANTAARLMPVGTTIITARGTVGRCALVGTPMAMNQSCYGLRGASDGTDFFTYFSVRKLVGELQQRAHGSVFDTITRDTFRAVAIPRIPTEIARAFDRQVAPIMGKILSNLREVFALADLRDSLLPHLLSGEVRLTRANASGFTKTQSQREIQIAGKAA